MLSRRSHLAACAAAAALALSGCCSATSPSTATARTGSANNADDSKSATLPTPLDLALVPLQIAYYFYNPFLDTSRPSEAERFDQSARQTARNPRS